MIFYSSSFLADTCFPTSGDAEAERKTPFPTASSGFLTSFIPHLSDCYMFSMTPSRLARLVITEWSHQMLAELASAIPQAMNVMMSIVMPT